MNILVTGASGFIGRHLVERLVGLGYHIRALTSGTGDPEKQKFLKGQEVEIFVGNLANPSSLDGVGENIEVLFHLGAVLPSKAGSSEDYSQVNERGTHSLLEAFKFPPKKVILMSSVSAVGPYQGTPVSDKTVCNQVDGYGVSKLAQERIVLQYCQTKQIPLVILRPPPVYGPRDPAILKLLRAVNGRIFPIRSDDRCMDYIYVENLVGACILVMEKGNGTYHVSDGRKYSLNEILESILVAQGKSLLPVYFPNSSLTLASHLVEFFSNRFKFRPPIQYGTFLWMTKRYWYSDISKIEALGYRASIELDEGIRRTVNFFRNEGVIGTSLRRKFS